MPLNSESPPSLKHELRTPLNHIIGFCEMLIEEAGDEASGSATKLVSDLEKIHAAGRRLLGVINDLFDASIPEAERLEESHIHHEVRTPLNQIIGYTELLQEDATESGDTSVFLDLAKIHSAAHKLLELVLANFGSTRFSVDESERLNPDNPVSLLHRNSSGQRQKNLTGHILVADDDEANRDMLDRRLRRLGHTVAIATGGREAVEMIRTGSYDLLLLDIIMPEMNGYEVLEHLQANPPMKSLPVIALSASDNSDNVARCIEIGAEDYLPKPFDPALLQARIDSSLEKKRLRDREDEYLRTIQRERERSDDLLHVILPSNIAAELKNTGDVMPRRIDNVAVLFADVVGFTAYCEKRAPETIHRDLQDLVREFEILSGAYGMEKIKTIGDAYLAAAGLIHITANPTLDCVSCGLAMIKAAERLPAAWKIRVGIHTGPVVAGVVGRQKYQYDIWGDTVNAAARMETEAQPGTLCVNSETWQRVEHQCFGRSLGSREVKGKGSQQIFEINAIKDIS